MNVNALENPRQVEINRYPVHAPRLWHAMSFGVFWKLLSDNRFGFTRDRFGIVATALLVSLFNSMLNRVSSFFFDKAITRTQLHEAPIFVIGHWRTGTTYLHELLACDERYVAPNTYQCMAPRHFLLTERLLAPLLQRLLPERRPQDNMAIRMDGPQEDEFALLAAGVPSVYRTLAFPANGFKDVESLSLEALSKDERRRWMDAWTGFLRRVTYRGGGRPCLLKSPAHTARVRSILEIFPNARFVHVTRNPRRIYASTTHMIYALAKTQTLQKFETRKVRQSFEDAILENFNTLHDSFERDRALIASGRIVDISYEELVEDPEAAVQKIYDELGIDFAAIEAKLRSVLEDREPYVMNEYIEAKAESRVIERRWRNYMNRYGYGCSSEG